MSIKELDQLSRQFKTSSDATVVRKDISLYQKDLKKEAAPFLDEIERIAKKEKRNNVILIGVIYE